MSKLFRPALLSRDELDTPIEIREIYAAPLDLPLSEPFHIASDDSKNAGTDNVVIQILTDDGSVGVGEAAPFFGISGDSQKSLLADIKKASPSLTGMRGTIFQYEEELRRSLKFPAMRAAVEMALFDILAKSCDLPLCTLLNPESSPVPIETDITIPLLGKQAAAARARNFFGMGFSRIKIKVGDGVEAAMRRVGAVVNSFSGGSGSARLRVLIDANEGFDPDEALRLLENLDFARNALKIFEQPVGRDDLPGMKRVSEVMSLLGGAVYADESVYTLDHARAVARTSSAGGINLKLMKHGGIIEAIRIAELARKAGLKVMVGQMIESKIATSAGYHLAMALRPDWCDLDMPMFLGHSGMFTGGVTYNGPIIMPPQLMGIGVSRAAIF